MGEGEGREGGRHTYILSAQWMNEWSYADHDNCDGKDDKDSDDEDGNEKNDNADDDDDDG